MARQASQALQGLPSIRVQAVDCLGQNFGAGGFAGAPGAGEQVGMGSFSRSSAGFSGSGSHAACPDTSSKVWGRYFRYSA